MSRFTAVAVAVSLAAGCAKTAPVHPGQDGPDADVDGDSDGDVDGDSDGDGDGDGDSDTDSGTADPAIVWVKRAGGPGRDAAVSVAIAADGTVIAAGTFEETAVFGQGEPNETALVSAGERDLFVAAFDQYGSLRWARRAGHAEEDEEPRDVAVFADGSSVITGAAWSGAVFGEGEPNEAVLPWDGIFVAWYGADGGLLDLRYAGSGGGSASAALADGSVIVAGEYHGTVLFGEGEPGETELSPPPGTDQMFVARYDPSHALVFARSASNSEDGDAHARDVAAFPDGSFAVAGDFWGAAILGPGGPNETALTAQGNEDILIARFDADGELEWARSETSLGPPPAFGSIENARAVGRLGADGVIVSGNYDYSIIFGEGEPEETELSGTLGGMFVAAYGPAGDLAWAVRAGRGAGYALASAGEGAGPIYAAGLFGWLSDTMTFGPETPGECTLASAGNIDIGLARYDSGGGVAWARAMGGAGDEWLGALAAMPDGSPVLVGSFEETAKFDLGLPADDTIVSAGASDIFIARIAP